MTTQRKRAVKLLVLVLLELTFVLTNFYLSEPKYINNVASKKIEVGDWVAIPEYTYSWDRSAGNEQVKTGIVVQTDDSVATLKISHDIGSTYQYTIFTKNSSSYRIIGRGTIYHRINGWIGFNIMFCTTFVMCVILVLTATTNFKLLYSLFD